MDTSNQNRITTASFLESTELLRVDFADGGFRMFQTEELSFVLTPPEMASVKVSEFGDDALVFDLCTGDKLVIYADVLRALPMTTT